MISRIQPYNVQPAFGAKVNMDLRCRKYYNECDEFKRVMDLIRDKVQSPEVDIKSAVTSHWTGTRKIYALSENIKGGFTEWLLGEICTIPMKTVSIVDNKRVLKESSTTFRLSSTVESYDKSDKEQGERLNLLLYFTEF